MSFPRTKQEIFDQVLQHLRTQKQASLISNSDGKDCAYRGDHGLKCAIGAFIPDHLYSPEMEGKSLKSFCQTNPELDKLFGAQLKFWETMQYLHDVWNPFYWEIQAKDIAKRHNLIYTPIE
jgi:hypothetical protein